MKQEINWQETLELWCIKKAENPKLTAREFADMVGRNVNTIKSKCTKGVVRAYKQLMAQKERGELPEGFVINYFELWEKSNGHAVVRDSVPKEHGNIGNQNARKSGIWSDYVHKKDIALAIDAMDGDIDYQDEILVRAKIAGLLRASKALDDAEEKVEQRIKDNDGISTDLDAEEMASIRKSRNRNLQDTDMMLGRLDQLRTSRKRELLIDADTRLKRLTGDKVDAESGGSDELDLDGLLEKVNAGKAHD